MPTTQPPANVNSSSFTAIVTVSHCKTVTVREVDQASTTDYLVAAPTSGSGPTTVPAGSSFTFAHPGPGTVYAPGTTVGYLKTISGSVNFDVVEQ
ncbi:MAG TPA: hypothetical protein VI685_17570 [Candidatus Angelobacter sp.]